MTMSPARARATRLPQLTAEVQSGSRCTNKEAPLAVDWSRKDREPRLEWAIRRVELQQFCAGCPVLAQCREVALRLDTHLDNGEDDLVRGGMTTEQLHKTRRSNQHRRSLDRAIAADTAYETDNAERHRIAKLSQQLREANLTGADPRSRAAAGTVRPRPNSVARAKAAADELRALRTIRRERTGWAARSAA